MKKFFSQNGFSLVEVLVGFGLLGILSMALMSLITNQNNEVAALDEKITLQNLQTQLGTNLMDSQFCGCLMQGHTFHYGRKDWNTFPDSIAQSYGPSCISSGTPLLQVGASHSGRLRPTRISMRNISEVTAGSGFFSGIVAIEFDATLMKRARKALSIPVMFSVNMTDPVNARRMVICGSTGGSRASLSQVNCSRISVSSGRAMCPIGQYVAGVEQGGVVCCEP